MQKNISSQNYLKLVVENSDLSMNKDDFLSGKILQDFGCYEVAEKIVGLKLLPASFFRFQFSYCIHNLSVAGFVSLSMFLISTAWTVTKVASIH